MTTRRTCSRSPSAPSRRSRPASTPYPRTASPSSTPWPRAFSTAVDLISPRLSALVYSALASGLRPSARTATQHHLGLDGEREKATRLVGDARLPDLSAPAPVDGRALGADETSARAREEVGLGLQRGGAGGISRKIEEGPRRPHQV